MSLDIPSIKRVEDPLRIWILENDCKKTLIGFFKILRASYNWGMLVTMQFGVSCFTVQSENLEHHSMEGKPVFIWLLTWDYWWALVGMKMKFPVS
jgi:hypothetical protein